VRLGLYLNLFCPSTGGEDHCSCLDEITEQARLAEQAGFAWVVLGERHVYRPGYHEVLTSLAWLAAKTERIGLATAGIIAPLYSPVLLAETLAHIDVMSRGRLTAGFVLGYRPEEFALFGVQQPERVPRFEETLKLVKALWSGDPVTHEGRFTSLQDAFVSPRPWQQPRPRIWNGGRVSAVLARTAELCDGWSTSFNETDDELVEKIAEYRSYPAGPDVLGSEVIVCREGFCAATAEEAREALEPPLNELYGAYTGWKRTSVDAARYSQDWETIRQRAVIGSPQDCVERVQDYSGMGADGVVLRVQPPGLSHEATMRCIERLGDSVLPQLSGAPA
jgi:alkanesulfonate monooxygenase SsuD/methylene tetrahydromethanopterin reductase-like flavin-dependent oxidoreductase (luciferase family)